MSYVLFISEDRLKDSTAINMNVDVNLLLPYVRQSQRIRVEPALGSPLYNKLKSLIVKLKTENSKIVNELNLKDESLVKKSDELKDWKEKYRSLKMANTFLGSNDKSLTKLKINNLIKELDKCILNLNS